MTGNDKIIEKIQKLLALSGSCNTHEAENAMKKAQELMTKHNIEMQTVDNYDSEYINETSETYKRANAEAKYINNILTGYFFVKIIQSKRSTGNYLNIVGEKNNVKTAMHMRTYLTNVFKVLWSAHKKENNLTVKSKQSFYTGIYTGFCEKMDLQRKETEMKYEVVLVNDPKVDDKVNELFSNLTKGARTSMSTSDSAAYNAGKSQGRKLNVNSGSIA